MGGGSGGVSISPGERTNADIAQQQWNDYKTMYMPQDTQMIARAQDKNRGRTLGVNMAAGGAGLAYDAATQGVIKNLESSGVNPNSGKFAMATADMSRSRGSGVGKAAVGGDISADKRYAGGMFNVISHGRGQQGIGLGGIRDSAMVQSSAAINDAMWKSRENAAMTQGLTKLAGAGIGYGIGKYQQNNSLTADVNGLVNNSGLY